MIGTIHHHSLFEENSPIISAIEPLKAFKGFPGGAVVKSPPANVGDMGSNPGPGRSHMPRSI